MAGQSGIEWTGSTWNPVRGCSRVSEGCRHCYAETMAARFSKPGQWGRGLAFWATRPDGKKEARWTGTVMAAPDHVLTEPLRWKAPRTIFVNSTSDLFHEDLPDEVIDRVFAVMALCPQHTFQVLTKRPERMRDYVSRVEKTWCTPEGTADWEAIGRAAVAISGDEWKYVLPEEWPLPNVWLGTSVEDQATADARIPHLLATPAAIRFISAEPLLGPVDLTSLDINGDGETDALNPMSWAEAIEDWRDTDPDWEEQFLDWFWLSRMPTEGNVCATLDWVICGGESGPGARPMHPDWARSLRDQCAAAAVPFFFKQWGAYRPMHGMDSRSDWLILNVGGDLDIPDERWPDEEQGEVAVLSCTKKAAGRLLDGVTHDGMPKTQNLEAA